MSEPAVIVIMSVNATPKLQHLFNLRLIIELLDIGQLWVPLPTGRFSRSQLRRGGRTDNSEKHAIYVAGVRYDAI